MRPGCRARCSTSCVHDADNVTAHGQGPTLHKSLKTIKTCASNSQKCSTMIPRLNESDTLSLHSCSAWLESLDSIIRRIIPNVAVSSFAELKKLQLRCAMSNNRRCSANIKKCTVLLLIQLTGWKKAASLPASPGQLESQRCVGKIRFIHRN